MASSDLPVGPALDVFFADPEVISVIDNPLARLDIFSLGTKLFIVVSTLLILADEAYPLDPNQLLEEDPSGLPMGEQSGFFICSAVSRSNK